MNSSVRSVLKICRLSSSTAWAGSRNCRRNTRMRYFAWKAVMEDSIPLPATSPMTAARRPGVTSNTSKKSPAMRPDPAR